MKYIICNLKTHLNDLNIKDYLDTIKKITYTNVIFCVPNNYINLFKKHKLCTQDYYDEINEEYVLINHHDNNQPKDIVRDKIEKAINKNIKVILCVGNNDIKDYFEIKSQLDYFKVNSKNIIVAYEPYKMIGTNNKIDIADIDNVVKKIKKDFNNITVLYGGNVNLKNIEDILKITDGVLIARLSYNPYKLTNVLNKITKSI